MRASRTVFAAIALLLIAGHASAATVLEWRPVDDSAALDGYVTQDLIVTTDDAWTSAQILIELNAGAIFYHEEGDRTPPHPLLFDSLPALEFDTYFAAGENATSSSPSFGGGAVDLGGDAEAQYEPQLLNVNWFTTEGPTGELFLGRFTLTDDASGVWSTRIGTDAGPLLVEDMPVSAGTLVIPEPASAVLFGATGLAMLRRRPSR